MRRTILEDKCDYCQKEMTDGTKHITQDGRFYCDVCYEKIGDLVRNTNLCFMDLHRYMVARLSDYLIETSNLLTVDDGIPPPSIRQRIKVYEADLFALMNVFLDELIEPMQNFIDEMGRKKKQTKPKKKSAIGKEENDPLSDWLRQTKPTGVLH